MPLQFRRVPLTYLRRLGLAAAALLGIGIAACFPPSAALPLAATVARDLARGWFYFCSMMLGATPFLAAGAMGAAAGKRMLRVLPFFAVIFPGCDCSMNALASSLRGAPPAVSAFALVWGSCCNPLTLVSTAAILGPRMLVNRLVAGAIAATLTAALWWKLPVQGTTATCTQTYGFWRAFVDFGAGGIATFATAALVSATCLTFFANAFHSVTPISAAIVGALLSPCSSADAVLARVLFALPAAQLAFVVAAQCLDVRQMSLLWRSFGALHAAGAFVAGLVACWVGSVLAAR